MLTEENFGVPRKKEKLNSTYYGIVIRNRKTEDLVRFTVNTLDEAAIIVDSMVKDVEEGLHALLYKIEELEK